MQTGPQWIKAADRDALRGDGAKVIKANGKQILILDTQDGLFAINNRCPHEGYPLSEGTLSCGGILTCNWHNWKFDLKTGRTLDGGDPVRTYPLEDRQGEIWIDVSDPPADELKERALENFKAAFEDYDYTRLARELARLQKAGGEVEEALRAAVFRSYDRFEFGMGHAFGAAPDWLALADVYAADEADRLCAVLEVAAHMSRDALREPVFPFTEERLDYKGAELVDAIEREDEDRAVAFVRDALRAGLTYTDLRPALARAALAHYAGFGHSTIYVYKAGQLIERLGPEVTEPVTLALIRELIYARREDLIPEFRGYADALKDWTGRGADPVSAESFIGRSVTDCISRTLASSGQGEELYHALFGAAAWNLLHFDDTYDRRTDLPVSSNVSWLDFTHAFTFANAARVLCTQTPQLWPAALLQMALFVGRNTRFIDPEIDSSPWQVDNAAAFFKEKGPDLFDHGIYRHIIAAHLAKTFTAVKEEYASAPDAAWTGTALAALNRFLSSPLRGRHVRRTAQQAQSFVALEG